MHGPLANIRILDLSRLLPGGYCTQMLADLGADVIKVEDTGAGDYVRDLPPFHEGTDDSVRSAAFLALNRNKRSIQLNLKTADGREALLALARDADVLLESFRPGALDRLGLGYATFAQANPGLIYCAITGYGLTGPNVTRSGHDINYMALSGVLALSGEADGPPIPAAAQIADVGGGALMAVAGILAALRERDGTSSAQGSGLGQVVDVSMFDGVLSWMAVPAAEVMFAGQSPRRGDFIFGGALSCYGAYRCRDGWVAFGAVEPKFWVAWCEGVGRPDLVPARDSRAGSAERREIEKVFVERTRNEWAAFADEVDCCLEPVLELDEALDSELVAKREMVVSLNHPDLAGPVRVVGSPIRMSRTPADPHRRPAPRLGGHTREVLASVGYDNEAIENLIARGAAAG